MEKQWILRRKADPDKIEYLSKSINVSKPVANLLINRGIENYDDAKNFFRPNIDNLLDPFLMQDMDSAVSRIEKAVENGEGVMVFGDYDVDGTTSVSMMYSFLLNKIKNLIYYIPDRYHEGYGISLKGVDKAKAENCSLIIALDCGIKANDKVDYATKQGVDFIICDHHEPGEDVPKAIAVLDPKRTTCGYPFKELSACGVGFKLIQAYASRNSIPFSDIEPLLDLVVVSIASDIVPIVDENRVLAYYGLKQLNSKPRIGIKAIIDIAGAKTGNLKITDLVFKIGPRINAAGRMEQGQFSVNLLVSTSKDEANDIANRIDENNTDRREFDTNITKEAKGMIENNLASKGKKSTVLYNPSWHKGVLGIVASRVIETYYKPTIILTLSNGFVTGSARSVKGFDLYKAIDKCQHLLVSFGGHKYAAGLTLKEENVAEFVEEFEKQVCETIDPESEIQKISIDEDISIDAISQKFFDILDQFEPFGPGNMAPVFVTKNARDTGYGKRVGGDGEHLKLSVTDSTTSKWYSAIAFKMGDKIDAITDAKFSICYSLDENTYNGKTSIQLRVRDIK